MTERRANAWGWALAGAFLALGLAVTFRPMLFSGFERIQTDPGDTTLNHYFLEHSYLWAFDEAYPFGLWSPGFFAPTPMVLTYSENLLGTAPLYWGFRLAGLGEVAAFGLWIVVINAANYVAMVVVLRWGRVAWPLAILAGYTFAFGSPRLDQFEHQHLMPQAMTPFAVWFALRFLERPRVYPLAMILGLTAWQLVASIHLGWFLVFGLTLTALLQWAFRPESRRAVVAFLRARPVAVGAMMAVWAVGLGLFFAPYFEANRGHARRFSDALLYMPMPVEWAVATTGTWWDDYVFRAAVQSNKERRLFWGLAVWAVLLVGGVALARDRVGRRRPEFALLVVGGVLAASVTNYFVGISPWYFVNLVVPGADAIRCPGRAVLLVLPFALVAACASWRDSLALRRRRILPWMLLALAVSEAYQREPLSFEADTFYGPARRMAEEYPGYDLVFYRPDSNTLEYYEELQAMWAALDARVPTANGYSGRWPDPFVGWWLDTEEWLSARLPDEWAGRVLVTGPRHGGEFGIYEKAAGGPVRRVR